MKLSLSLILLIIAFASTPTWAIDYLFVDYTVTQKTFGILGGDPNAQYTYVVSQASGTGQTQFALSSGGPFATSQQLQFTTDGSGAGTINYWVKGTTVGTSNIHFCGLDGGGCIGPDAWEVVTINTLEYQVVNSALDTNPNPGGGSRIYPDKQSPSDNVNRRIVRVKATLSGTANNMPVSFKSFDLDDPSDDTGGAVDPNDIGGVPTGDDNRAATNKSGVLSQVGQSGTTNTIVINTDSTGVANADFQVTMNPGDNFMVAAGGDPSVVSGITISGITLKDSANNTLPVTKAKNTPMLTVWRKIHLEVDNMGAVGTNHELGTVSSASVSGGKTTINLSAGQSIDSGRYSASVNGPTVTIAGKININNHTYDVFSNTATQVVVNQSLNVNQITNKSFTIYDDDDYDGDGAWQGDENETSIASLNAFTKMQTSDSASSNVYAPAYIMPVYDGGGNVNNNGTVTWAANISHTSAAEQSQLNNNRGASGSDDFWVGYMQVGYQSDTTLDFDPNSETSSLVGDTPGTTGNSANADCSGVPQGFAGSLLFQETQHDAFTFVGQANDNLTAPHELGHQFGLQGDGSSGGPWGIMDGSYNVSTFVPAHIHILRCRVKTPGA